MTQVELYGQFLLSCDPTASPPQDWNRYSLDGHFLASHPALPVNLIRDAAGAEVGFVLGWAIEQGALQDRIILPCAANPNDVQALENYLDRLGGRYVILFLANDFKRLYLDPGGTLGVVYNARAKTIGSTVTALLYRDPDHPVFRKPVGEFPDNRPNQYYPAGTTAAPEIRRLLPNHYLDLTTWSAVRHYPIHGLSPVNESEAELIVLHLVQNIKAVIDAAPRVYMSLTAGRDSRTLLACSRQWVNGLNCFTFDFSPWRNERSDEVDYAAAKTIANRFDLKHEFIPVGEVSHDVALEYLRRIGFAGGAGKARDFYAGCRDHLAMDAAWITGLNGGVGKCFYGRPGDRETDPMRPADLVRRMNLPDAFESALEDWLRGIPEMPLSTLLDLAYLEHRCGCWAAPHIYGAAPFRLIMTPYNHRVIYDTMLRLPVEYRRSKLLFRDIIRRTWPALETLPFNEFSGIRRFFGPQSLYGKTKRNMKRKIKSLLGR